MNKKEFIKKINDNKIIKEKVIKNESIDIYKQERPYLKRKASLPKK